jgi:hypothetical protein
LLINGRADTKYFDGLVKRIEEDPDKVEVTTAETTMVKRLKALRDGIPVTLRSAVNLCILMSVADFDRYDEELTSRHGKGVDYENITPARFKGIRIETLAQWPEGLFVATPCGQDIHSNLWAGVNLASDAEAVQIDKTANASELYFVKMLMKADTQIAQGENLVCLDTRENGAV